ncbi:MAG TPA: cupredoxin family copper-binding protein [Rudaea sp.]|jgi:plastocyanin|uniref:cupredoxin domain-containing protein n=1 Tax=Rudaea sp. TaxID=2136325 RepID=UPI002F9381E7
MRYSLSYPVRAGALLAMICTACVAPVVFATDAPAPSVEITKFAFTPKEITVAPGAKIVWTNHDETPHTVTSADKTFASKALDTDDRYEYTFTNEGDFSYYCTVHPFMTGIVHVRRQ